MSVNCSTNLQTLADLRRLKVMKQTFLDGNGGGVKSPRSVVGCVDEGDGW